MDKLLVGLPLDVIFATATRMTGAVICILSNCMKITLEQRMFILMPGFSIKYMSTCPQHLGGFLACKSFLTI